MSSPLSTILSNLNTKKDGPLAPEYIEAHYIPRVVDVVMARTLDGLLVADEINRMGRLTKQDHYLYYYYRLPKSKYRFGSKVTVPSIPKYEDMVMDFFGYSRFKARQAMAILTEDELKEIELNLNEGGVEK